LSQFSSPSFRFGIGRRRRSRRFGESVKRRKTSSLLRKTSSVIGVSSNLSARSSALRKR